MACTTAEGVETEEQSEILNRLGCDFQGFLLPKPMEKEMLRQFLGGLSGILCGGPVSSVEEPLAKDDGELCLCLDPFPRRPFPLLGRVVKNEI
ncbi:hypothetical protein CDO31_21090 (plasmid) [Sinorhizobium meliloti]|nr:hypothetical protein CDO31_21090 [Sinorhizobium meliloti]